MIDFDMIFQDRGPDPLHLYKFCSQLHLGHYPARYNSPWKHCQFIGWQTQLQSHLGVIEILQSA